MRGVIQRVAEAAVSVEGRTVGEIGAGLLVLLSVDKDDEDQDVAYMVDKIAGLRIFNDADGKFNLSVGDAGGSLLVVSQFTLHGDCRRGRRPSFSDAARPEKAVPMYEAVVRRLRGAGFTVATGEFGAHMRVRLVNDGPVTILLDSKKGF
ncbi:MAG: D-tyrosyl-tRNA(Tyr) deacylase [Candidatus Hydrogenedentes bacterium]|nr:D-tyrosyl-tRNA(Tyr) deacylase [Candidatus Hydrogenedentota bacterium]